MSTLPALTAPRKRLLLIGLLLLAAASLHADAERVVADREAFLTASALLTSDPDRYAEQRRKLEGYVLAPYLDYARLRRDLTTVDAATARRFLDPEATTQLGAQFRGEYLLELARRGDWPGFLAFDNAAAPTTTLLRCQRLRALLATERNTAARGELATLWATGQSLPDACEEPFATVRGRGWLTSELVWQRLRLAIDAANPALVAYLVRLLPEAERADGERLARALIYREAAVVALQRRARAEVASAIGHWSTLAPRFSFTPSDRTKVLQSLALYTAVAYQPEAESWFEQVPVEGRTEQLMDWQLRAALAAEDWPTVLKVADGLPATLAATSRPRYWRARALAGVERAAEARDLYSVLATEATFHGFLAADRLDAPYTNCPKDITPDPARVAALRGQTDVARALELHAVGRRVEANRAWDFALVNLSDSDRLQLALLASAQGWHDRVAFALASGDNLRHYALRFPVAEQDTVERQSALNKLDPAWTLALIRAESAWQPDVRSGANAWGLMQLLPATGQQMARQLGVNWRGTSTLLDPQTNIQLGSRYLAQQAERFQGSALLATAASNAGPTPVKRWLAERGALPADVFVETIPYKETRDYVARVQAFSVIYDWRLHGKVRPLSSRLTLPGDREPAGKRAELRSVVCPGTAVSGPG